MRRPRRSPRSIAPRSRRRRSRILAIAADALGAFDRTNKRVSDLLADEQPLTASAVVFTDAAQSLANVASALHRAHAHQRAAADEQTARGRLTEAYALGGAAGLTLIVLLLLLPRGAARPIAPEQLAPVAVGLGLSMATTKDLDLDLKRPDAAPSAAVPPEPPRESEAQIAADLDREQQLVLDTTPTFDLQQAARLCTDLACVKDTAELWSMLARAADLMDAAGVVVWMGGVGVAELKPAVSHGYSDHTMAKMKSLSTAGESAVAVAFRGGRLEVVPGTSGRNGAIVVPIRTASGCVGAMAVEIRGGAETNLGVQALVTIIGAQLSTLVSESS